MKQLNSNEMQQLNVGDELWIKLRFINYSELFYGRVIEITPDILSVQSDIFIYHLPFAYIGIAFQIFK